MIPRHSVGPALFWPLNYEDAVPFTLECLYRGISKISEHAHAKGLPVWGVPGSGGSDFGGSRPARRLAHFRKLTSWESRFFGLANEVSRMHSYKLPFFRLVSRPFFGPHFGA